jgi:hypothetical protein
MCRMLAHAEKTIYSSALSFSYLHRWVLLIRDWVARGLRSRILVHHHMDNEVVDFVPVVRGGVGRTGFRGEVFG